MARPDWWPTADDWINAAERLRLKRSGSELVGPCPACNGTDRFHVHWRGARRGVFACRHGCDWRPILEAAGFGRGGAAPPELRNRPLPAPARSRPPEPKTDPVKAERAAALWRQTQADPGAIGAYLAARGVWPPGEPLPDSVRWLPRSALTARRWREGPPASAAGAMACRFDASGEIRAVSIEALTAAGERTDPRFRRTIGQRVDAGALFDAGGDGPAIVLAEGEVSALACRWLHPGERCFGAGGTAGLAAANLPADKPVTVRCDGDGVGRKAAAVLQDAALARGASIRLAFALPGCDPAEEIAAEIDERAAILEFEGGMTREAAIHAAWRDLLP